MRMINADRFREIMEQWKKDCLADNDTQGADIISDVILQLDDMSTLTQSNEPLTLDELREMNGKPVWIENLEEPEKSQWRLCHWDRRKYLVLQGISIGGYLVEEYGEAWIAYAYPPVHIDRKKWEPCKKCSGEYQQKIIALVERYHGCITETSNIDVNFCPVCGRPITDEA